MQINTHFTQRNFPGANSGQLPQVRLWNSLRIADQLREPDSLGVMNGDRAPGLSLAQSSVAATQPIEISDRRGYPGPLLLREWIVLPLLEAAIIAYGLDWLLKRLNHRKVQI